MQEYKISRDELIKTNDYLYEGYGIYEINTYMGYAEIVLKHKEYGDTRSIYMDTIS